MNTASEGVVPLGGLCWRADIANGGLIKTFVAKCPQTSEILIDFRTDRFAGPSWHGEWDGGVHKVSLVSAPGENAFVGRSGALVFGLRYEARPEGMVIHATVCNEGGDPFRPVRCGLKLGLDTYMESFPDWNRKLFPTQLRCEATHFWGYCMSPEGAILGIASPDPVASWSLDYNRASYGDYGHRIYTLNLDLINAMPLPPRHPHRDELPSGESLHWRIFLAPVDRLENVQATLAPLCEAPLLEVDRLTLLPSETARILVHAVDKITTLSVRTPRGRCHALAAGENDGIFAFEATEGEGVYTLLAESSNGRRSEAKIFARRPWSWYLKAARSESLRVPQKASTHCEAWLGLFTQLHARRHFPNAELDEQAEAKFQEIVSRMFDLGKREPNYYKPRISNSAYMAGVFAARYRCTGDVADLEIAAGLADFVIGYQNEAGAYCGSAGREEPNVHYTSVTYIAKSLMEVLIEEEKLAAGAPIWSERAERHRRSVKMAIDDLARQMDNIQTEGEFTFEDGMISCAAAQLGMFALLHDDRRGRECYIQAAAGLLRKHRCLELLRIPDCRMNGATLRFWESQYDVLLNPNMMNAPHGWTSWKTYATWYLYLLTGEESYLEQTMNTLGACVQMIETETGRLRWAFVPDPFVRGNQFGERHDCEIDGSRSRIFIEDPARPGSREGAMRILGEQYVEMVSDIYGGWCCDNDVHEHFKCLEEVALASAYIIERTDGTVAAWNCAFEKRGNVLHVRPSEEVVTALHCNIRHCARAVEVTFAGREVVAGKIHGMHWILSRRSDPIPFQGVSFYERSEPARLCHLQSEPKPYKPEWSAPFRNV